MDDELLTMLKSREWRLNNLYWIVDKNGNPVRFRLNWAQRELFNNLHYRNDVLKARQLGISTFAAILMLDYCLVNPHFEAGIIDKTEKDAKGKLEKIGFAYNRLDYVPPNPTQKDIALAAIGRDFKNKIHAQVNRTEVYFNNGAKISVGTNLRGNTMQLLHVSELGYVSARQPAKAKDIVTGGLNTVSPNGIIIRESTHEGGKYGINYQLTQESIANQGKELNNLDYKFFFFPWWGNPEYRIDTRRLMLDEPQEEYFDSLAESGISLDDGQKAWYVAMAKTQGFAMRQEYPSVPAEAFDKIADGAIFKNEMYRLRREGRVNDRFNVSGMSPLYVFVDIGMSDATALWLVEETKTQHRVVDCYQCSNKPISHYIDHIKGWEQSYGRIECVLLPHDGGKNDVTKRTYADHLRDGGISNTKVVPRIPDVWVGIDDLRQYLLNCVIHERCSHSIHVDGVEYISGLNALDNYTTANKDSRTARVMPLHDVCSHFVDALRIGAEAYAKGMISPDYSRVSLQQYKPRLAIGVRDRSSGGRRY